MREALERVKRELGPQAVIFGTRSLPSDPDAAGAGRRSVEISAAAAVGPVCNRSSPNDSEAPPRRSAPQRGASAASLPEHLYPYYVRLVQNEVAEELAEQLVRQAARGLPAGAAADPVALRTAVRTAIARLIPADVGAAERTAAPRRLAFVGPAGSGKTTTIAKLAAQFKLRHKRPVALLSLDTQRVAAHEQLRRYAEIIAVPLYTAQTPAEVKNCVRQLGAADSVLIDTPGLGLREQGRVARLAALLHGAAVDETHLVMPATLAPAVQARVVTCFAPLQPARLVLTRLDDAIGFGVILDVMRRINMRVSYVTTGQRVPNDIETACGQRVAELLLGAST